MIKECSKIILRNCDYQAWKSHHIYHMKIDKSYKVKEYNFFLNCIHQIFFQIFHHPLFVSAISVKYLYPVFIKDGMSHRNALVKRCGSSQYEIQLMCGHRCVLVGYFTKAVNTAAHRSLET